eukprot:5743103-Pyramimonas_sp.AAC.1
MRSWRASVRVGRVGGELEGPEVHVGKVAWGPAAEPRRGRVHIKGRIRDILDYRDQLTVTGELAEHLPDCQAGEAEER